jgi:methylthioribose-1-phosphate isomerase
MRCGIPATLIADSMAATCMATGRVDCVLVGADRICANGDAANKIGTLSLAVLAAHFGLPFYVVAPRSSIDASLTSGAEIEIEQRDARELAGFTATGLITPANSAEADALRLLTEAGARELSLDAGQRLSLVREEAGYRLDGWFSSTPEGAAVFNPAFDVTPGELITAIVTEDGVFRAPYCFTE